MGTNEKLRQFEASISPHLGSAFNLAFWIARRREDAEDIVQEAFLRAFRSWDSFRGGDGKPWLLAIVRNTAMSQLRRDKSSLATPLEEVAASLRSERAGDADPEALLLAAADRNRVHEAVAALPVEFREAIVLRELEGCSYREIANITDVPLGTVMSRLARGRENLRRLLA